LLKFFIQEKKQGFDYNWDWTKIDIQGVVDSMDVYIIDLFGGTIEN